MLRISRYRFTFLALEPIRLPTFPGSAVRGLFGHGLKRSACVTRQDDCSACALRRHCVYCYLFETPLTVDKRQYAPQPIVLDVHRLKRSYEAGEAFTIETTCVGNAYRHFPYLFQAWRQAGRRGLGSKNARFELTRVDALIFPDGDWRELFPAAGEAIARLEPFDWRLNPVDPLPADACANLLTPYRGKREGHLVTPESFGVQGFVVSLLRRISALQKLHDPSYPEIDLLPLIHATASLTMTRVDLRWNEWTRHSSRQHTHMNMGGVVGEFTVSGEGLRLLWPALQLGQWIQAGKNTLFGLGRYQIDTEERLA